MAVDAQLLENLVVVLIDALDYDAMRRASRIGADFDPDKEMAVEGVALRVIAEGLVEKLDARGTAEAFLIEVLKARPKREDLRDRAVACFPRLAEKLKDRVEIASAAVVKLPVTALPQATLKRLTDEI